MTRIKNRAATPTFYVALVGMIIFFFSWYFLTETLTLPRFKNIPDPLSVIIEWISIHPKYGVSLFTKPYYVDILYSMARTYAAFAGAVVFGVSLGIVMGWSRIFHNYTFPLVEIFRPMPPLSWIPLAVLVLPGIELPVVFVTFIAAFFATVLNTLLGVQSINRDYFLAAKCLGAKPRDILFHVVIPGSLPFIFTGLQIAMGIAWMSIVAGEIIAGQRGLGYYIYEAAALFQYEQVIMYMFTLGFLGYVSSVAIRYVGNFLMAWEEAKRKAR